MGQNPDRGEPDLAEILAVTALAIDEAALPDTAMGVTIRQAIAGMPPKPPGVMPAGGIKRLEWCVRTIAQAAHDGDAKRADTHLWALLRDLFTPAGGEANGRRPQQIRAAWLASPSREPAALLEIRAPAPRILSADAARHLLGDGYMQRLGADDPRDRVLALRAIPVALRDKLATTIAELALTDPEPYVRSEAIHVAATSNQKVKAKIADAVTPRLDDAAPETLIDALRTLAAMKSVVDPAALAPLVGDPHPGVRAAACRCVTRGSGSGSASPELESALITALGDSSPATRDAALQAAFRYDVASNATQIDALVDAVRGIVRDGPDVRAAIYLLLGLGPRAASAALDVVAALSTTDNPFQAHEALVAFGTLPAEARPLLEKHCFGPDSGIASAAAKVLDKLYGRNAVPVVPLALRLERAGREIQSADIDVRATGIFAAERMGADAAPLIPALRTLGDRIAGDTADDSIESGAELERIRDALLELGCPVDDLPRPPSKYQAYRGSTPHEGKVDGGYMIGDITGFKTHGVVSVPTSSLGLWDASTGALLFVVDDAQLLAVVPGRAEAGVIRTAVKPDAKYGGTSRADHVWLFERYAIPSGEVVASLALPEVFSYGWPSHLTIHDGNATVVGGDEDDPYQFTIAIGTTSDRLLSDKPASLRRPRAKPPTVPATPKAHARRARPPTIPATPRAKAKKKPVVKAKAAAKPKRTVKAVKKKKPRKR